MGCRVVDTSISALFRVQLTHGPWRVLWNVKSQGTTDAGGSLADGDLMDSTGVNGETAGDLVAGNESAIEEVPS